MKSSSASCLIVIVVVALSISSACCLSKVNSRLHATPKRMSINTSNTQKGSSTTTASSQDSEVGCFPEKNEFLQSLAQDRVGLLSKPQKIEKCGEEWSRFGTCCDTQSLDRYVKEMNGRIESARKGFLSDVVALSRDIQGQIDILTKHVSEKVLTDEKLIASVNKVVSSISASKATLDTILQTFEAHQNECLAMQLQFRSGSLCGICSGRSLAFISEGKAIISLEACKSTIQTCDNYWRQLIDIIDIIDNVEADLKKVKELSGVNDDIFKSPKHKELLTFIKQANLRSFLKSCEVTQNCHEKAAMGLCSTLMTIRKSDPLTKQSIESLEKTQETMNSVLSGMSNQLERERSRKGQHGAFANGSASSVWSEASRTCASKASSLRKLCLSNGYSYGEVTVWSYNYASSSSYSTKYSSTWMSYTWRYP